ncbi:hypothetical protein EXIGLDRAFT_702615 [Exidia glandulosa HHB12029]|uniref:Uncharacterized protein n=1 Tax=Exidia glandulosa HHB12029 TaxID=1314781 RepID=A0A165CG69_EXIGL|nr:hypothetical protein EXIGLDRAFT_702615 [Exidia glandulosa HHB12029]
MDAFATLPLELLPDIYRFAALDSVRKHPGWLGTSLALVSRHSYAIAIPILYDVVLLGPPNSSSHTKHLIVPFSPSRKDAVRLMALLKQAETRLEAFSGHWSAFVHLATDEGFRPTTVSMLYAGTGNPTFRVLMLPRPLRRLHLRIDSLERMPADIVQHCSALTHLILEPTWREFVYDHDPQVLADVLRVRLYNLREMCARLLKLEKLSRLIIRMDSLVEMAARSTTSELHAVLDAMADMAITLKDPRLVIDESSITSRALLLGSAGLREDALDNQGTRPSAPVNVTVLINLRRNASHTLVQDRYVVPRYGKLQHAQRGAADDVRSGAREEEDAGMCQMEQERRPYGGSQWMPLVLAGVVSVPREDVDSILGGTLVIEPHVRDARCASLVQRTEKRKTVGRSVAVVRDPQPAYTALAPQRVHDLDKIFRLECGYIEHQIVELMRDSADPIQARTYNFRIEEEREMSNRWEGGYNIA